MNKRKAFNFYRSYYDVALMLEGKDREEFLMAILHAEFTGEIVEPKSKAARIAFVGQRHSIEAQIEGYKHGLKTPSKPPRKTPLPQEQVQVQEKGQQAPLEEVLQYALSIEPKLIESSVVEKYNTWVSNGWQSSGIPINNWKALLKATIPHLPTTKPTKKNLDRLAANMALKVPSELERLLGQGWTKNEIETIAKS